MVQRKINHTKVIPSTQGSLSDIDPKKWDRIASDSAPHNA